MTAVIRYVDLTSGAVPGRIRGAAVQVVWSARVRTAVRGPLVLVLGAALAVGTGLPGAASTRALDPAPAATAGADCGAAPASADAGAASVLAARCDTDVEVLPERTEWSTTYAQPDGTTRLDLSAAAVRTQQDGAWVDVDSTVVPGTDGLRVAAPVTDMTFSDGTDGQPLVRMERDGHELAFDVPFPLPEPSVDGAQITYDEVLPGVDLVVTVNPDATGFSEVLRVESPEAAADPRLREIAFPVAVSDGLDVVEDQGGFAAQDAEGEAVFTSPVPAMWDSADAPAAAFPAFAAPGGRGSDAAGRAVGVQRAPDAEGGDRAVAPLGGEAVASMPVTVADDEVVIVPDAELLADPETVWPVHIDPSISGSINSWTAVRDAYGPNFGFAYDDGVGLCNRATSTTCERTFKSRVLWKFHGLEAIGALDPSEVVSATFSAVGTHSYSCTPAPVTLYWTNLFDPWTPWPGGDLWNPQDTRVVAHKSGCWDHPIRWIEFGATGAAQAVAQYDSSVLALGLAADETTMSAWKRYRYDATLSIQINRTPTLPTSVRTTEPDTGCTATAPYPAIKSTTPVLRAVLGDPDNENLAASFELYHDVTGEHIFVPGFGAPQVPGAEQAVRVPAGKLRHGQPYMWRVRSMDTSGRFSPFAGWCKFVVDLERPAVPGVAPVVPAGPGRAVYLEDGTAGGIGVPGSFVLTNGGSADVVGYQHAFDSSALGPVTPGASVTIPYLPGAAGPRTLRVASVDAAGNASDVRLYRFSVEFADGVARWRLDEAAGPTAAADSSGPPLTVTTSTTRGPGVRAELDEVAGDRALVFDSVQDVAASAGPVISTAGSFSVMAFVRLDPGATSGSATAVSQDGTFTSGFELGVREDGSCPAGLTRCFTFGRPTSDVATASTVVARSSVPVEPGAWYQVVGTQSVGDRTLQVSVCRLGTPDAKAEDTDAVTGTPATFAGTWSAEGPLRLGQARGDKSPVRPWPGSVSDVRLFHGVLAAPQIFTSCLAG
ncbi:LamG domain-containing protein [Cellulomonas cellasea]|uniref:LamG-like jellyroll fold domain-containing protein n=1 Tax=Cellulomonas cellasea TaxID=43670 RepID=A0A7W4UG31_9CELL|nr:LamG domain-containing protein [Cellulomonas cellasea]MBB2923533.1 hypothetical protein [Cellulomonas cellasea]